MGLFWMLARIIASSWKAKIRSYYEIIIVFRIRDRYIREMWKRIWILMSLRFAKINRIINSRHCDA